MVLEIFDVKAKTSSRPLLYFEMCDCVQLKPLLRFRGNFLEKENDLKPFLFL